MANLDPTGPSQPSLNTAYDHPANPAESTPAEDHRNNSTLASQQRSDPAQEIRRPNDVDQIQAHPTALASGHLSSTHADNPSALGSNPASNTDGEQMRAAGEGDIAAAQDRKSQSGVGEERDLTAGLEGKKREQRGLRGAGKGEGGGGGVDLGRAMEGKGAFVGAGGDESGGGGGRSAGDMGGSSSLGMQSGHGQV